QQIQQEQGGQSGEDQAAKQQAEDAMRRDVLATVLDSAARERLSRIALVSPDRSRQIEAVLLRMAQTGQLRGRVNEQQLIGLLEQVRAEEAGSTAKKGAIVYQRRELDDDDDF
ncbi:PDCD5-related protein, partial [Vararia minispora EC-137]